WAGGRGRLGDAETDTLLGALTGWLERSGLSAAPAFALPDSLPFRYLGFHADSSGIRYTGDTVISERDPAGTGKFLEYLSLGSPGRAADSLVWSYGLTIEGDSLIASTERAFSSRLFGKI